MPNDSAAPWEKVESSHGMELQEEAKNVFHALTNTGTAKRVGSTVYAHSSRLPAAKLLEALESSAPVQDIVFRADTRKNTLAALYYPDFAADPHPRLEWLYRINVESGEMQHSSYQGRKTRPTLHRKELLVGASHPLYNTFGKLTRQEEEAGLFAEPKRIGWSNRWEDLLRAKGLRIEGHELRSTDAGN